MNCDTKGDMEKVQCRAFVSYRKINESQGNIPRKCSIKKLLLKISQNLRENICAGICIFIKKLILKTQGNSFQSQKFNFTSMYYVL